MAWQSKSGALISSIVMTGCWLPDSGGNRIDGGGQQVYVGGNRASGGQTSVLTVRQADVGGSGTTFQTSGTGAGTSETGGSCSLGGIGAGGCSCPSGGSGNCPDGFGDCSDAGSCTVSLLTNPLNCGACGHDCSQIDAHTNWTCDSGTCLVDSCLAGYGDCNDDSIDGCEHNVTGDVLNCGACMNKCHYAVCRDGMCFDSPSYLGYQGYTNHELFTVRPQFLVGIPIALHPGNLVVSLAAETSLPPNNTDQRQSFQLALYLDSGGHPSGDPISSSPSLLADNGTVEYPFPQPFQVQIDGIYWIMLLSNDNTNHDYVYLLQDVRVGSAAVKYATGITAWPTSSTWSSVALNTFVPANNSEADLHLIAGFFKN